MRLILYTGKGGVGKTTSAAATAAWAAETGRRTLVASADAAHSLGDVFGAEGALGGTPVSLAPNLDAVELDPRIELERHWRRIHGYLVSLLRHQGIEEIVADELALLPGAEEITTLLAVRRMAEAGDYELVIVDCAPTGSALRLMTAPEVVRGALRWLLRIQRGIASVATPIARGLVAIPLPEAAVFREAEELLYRQLRDLRGWLVREETHVRLVATPERLATEEALRTHTDLALFELPCDAVVMNRLLPASASQEPFFRDWARSEAEHLAALREAVAPLPVLEAPLREDEVIGVEALAAHGRELFGDTAPDAVMCHSPGLRFEATASGASVHVPLPHVAPADLDVLKLEGEIVLRTPGRRRALPLPRHFAALDLVRAKLEGGTLRLDLAPLATDDTPAAPS
ncbi:MAG: ArsA family ATPase [Myxococcota bacterium]